MTHPKNHYLNKVVCVTGAGGSIGSEICRRLVEYEAAKIIMVGHSEEPLYRIEKELAPKAPAGAIEVRLGSVTDAEFCQHTVTGCDIVIHAAAHKHVPICEENPVEAVANNVGGTVALAEACVTRGVAQFIMVSSDKAVKPSSVMGATKRVCELFVQSLAARAPRTAFTIVRFGNVLNSSGSVLPLWREQLRAGWPITVTDKRCMRYFMDIGEAVDLTLGAATLREGLYVLDMGEPRNIGEMAETLIKTTQFRAREPRIIEIGLRPGEKLVEELSYGGELVKTSLPKVLAVREDAKYVLKWNDVRDLIMAAKCRAKSLVLDQLWKMVK